MLSVKKNWLWSESNERYFPTRTGKSIPGSIIRTTFRSSTRSKWGLCAPWLTKSKISGLSVTMTSLAACLADLVVGFVVFLLTALILSSVTSQGLVWALRAGAFREEGVYCGFYIDNLIWAGRPSVSKNPNLSYENKTGDKPFQHKLL